MFPAPFVVIVDANLLYPFTLRDAVLRAAAAGFFQLRWSRGDPRRDGAEPRRERGDASRQG